MRGDRDLNSVQAYTGSLNDVLRKTMLSQEIVFKKQVLGYSKSRDKSWVMPWHNLGPQFFVHLHDWLSYKKKALQWENLVVYWCYVRHEKNRIVSFPLSASFWKIVNFGFHSKVGFTEVALHVFKMHIGKHVKK